MRVTFILITFFFTQALTAQNSIYLGIGLAPTHSFNQNFEPFDVIPIHLERFVEIGLQKTKKTFFLRAQSMNSSNVEIKTSKGDPSDSWYYQTNKSYSIYNLSFGLGMKSKIYSNNYFDIHIPLVIHAARSIYTETHTRYTWANQPDLFPRYARDDDLYIKTDVQLSTGLELNLNLLAERLYFKSAILYYSPTFKNLKLWHRSSFSFGMQYHLNGSGIKKYIDEYY